MSKEKIYSVSELSDLAGITKRTLHHYDEIGLLVPARRKDNGYREYQHKHLVMLQQILIYRAIDFSTQDIKQLLGAENHNLLDALNHQKNVLIKRQQETASMLGDLEATMSTVQGRRNSEILFDGIPTEKMDSWKEKIKKQVDGPAIERYQQWMQRLSEDESRTLKSEQDEFMEEYGRAIKLPVESQQVQDLVMRHYISTNRTLYKMHEGFKGIGSKGFAIMAREMQKQQLNIELYDYYLEGMAQHLGKAMIYFAENTLEDQQSELRQIGST